MIPIRKALISVYDKSNLDELCQVLRRYKVDIIATGSTYTHMKDKGFTAQLISDYTNFPELIHGRVKTLHPKIFGGILARPTHGEIEEIKQHDIDKIDLVVVNLYPFEQRAESTDQEEALCDEVDIGGVSLLRAAAKNFRNTVVLPKPSYYHDFIQSIQTHHGAVPPEFSKSMMKKTFFITSQYDWTIFQKFSSLDGESWQNRVLKKQSQLRYGENPHQNASYWINPLKEDDSELIMGCKILGGKELSYNNLLDVSAGLSLLDEFKDPMAAIFKHTNPCGVSIAPDINLALEKAFACDPVSAFGGVYFFNREITLPVAQFLSSRFVEIVLAPSFQPEALELLQQKKNLRLLQRIESKTTNEKIHSLYQGVLIQDTDHELYRDLKIVAGTEPKPERLSDLLFGLKVVKHVKSNAIVIVKDNCTLGLGMGQANRVQSVILALQQAGLKAKGAILVSDGYFPFTDSIEQAKSYGIDLIAEPGGSMRDAEVIEAAKANNITLILTGLRHFMH
jgi:phosphoribosylaminoimidazolecarboxamide formyltransferase / IMP cyclohydrolase